jgi:hypothetical protein
LSNYKISRNRINVLPIAIGITVLLSILPVTLLGWTSDIADLVRIPITPISHIGTIATSWVRPAGDPLGQLEDEIERNELAEAERDRFRQLYTAQMLRATELADQLRELQSLPESALRNPQPPIIVPIDITGKRSSDVAGTIELKLVTGAKERVRVGDIAVVGKDIVGRVSRVGLTRIELNPTTHKESSLTRAAIVPAHPTNGRHPLLAEIILQSNGTSEMYADVPATSGVQKGDLVMLDDPSWPRVASGLTLGIVDSVVQLDEAPLRQRVVILPRRRVRDMSRVIILGTGEAQE